MMMRKGILFGHIFAIMAGGSRDGNFPPPPIAKARCVQAQSIAAATNNNPSNYVDV
jgi:hypothetical protein